VALFGDEQFLTFGNNRPVVARAFHAGAVYCHPDAEIKAYIDGLPIDDKGLWAAKDPARPGACLIQTAEGARQFSLTVGRELARDRLIAWARDQARRGWEPNQRQSVSLRSAAGLITCMLETPDRLDAQGRLRFHIAKSIEDLDAVCEEAQQELKLDQSSVE